MSAGLYKSQYVFKTCKVLSSNSERLLSCLRQNSHGICAGACRKHQIVSLPLVQLRGCTFSSPTFAIPKMSESQTKDDVRMPKEAQQYSVGEENGWLNIGQYSVFAWCISGVESCVVVKCEDVQLTFDMGVAVSESVKSPCVFITHGHIDHVGAITSHVAKRELFGMKPARYYVPPNLVQPLLTVLRAHFEMAQTTELLSSANIQPVVEGDVVRLNSHYFVKAFPTIHRISSQGYIVYKEEKTLKEEYRGKEGFEVAALHRNGVDIHNITITPEIAYCGKIVHDSHPFVDIGMIVHDSSICCYWKDAYSQDFDFLALGDTIFDIFINPPTPDLLKVKLLITEATYLDDHIGKNMVQKARDFGHTHLQEIAQNAELFKDVGHIILVHFSNKYSARYIHDCIHQKLPPELREKVTPAVVAKATFPTGLS